jgi:hypothetical protein
VLLLNRSATESMLIQIARRTRPSRRKIGRRAVAALPGVVGAKTRSRSGATR